MKLRKPPYPDPVGTATYYLTHAGHREDAINLAIGLVQDGRERELLTSPDTLFGVSGAAEGAIESLIQGAWMREYHMWEVATKEYFDGQHLRNGSVQVNWRKNPAGAAAASHIERVRAQLGTFGASCPETVIDTIDRARDLVNKAKHDTETFITEADYRELLTAISAFWEALDLQEEFTPPIRTPKAPQFPSHL